MQDPSRVAVVIDKINIGKKNQGRKKLVQDHEKKLNTCKMLNQKLMSAKVM